MSRLLDTVTKAGTSDETLRRVLGLETTVHLWVERRLDEVVDMFPTGALSAEDWTLLRDELRALGMGDHPAAIKALTLSESSASSQ